MKKREQGILTVEASIVLTLMLLFILFLFSFGRVYRAQNLVSHATLQSADAVALESYLRETALQSDVSEVVHLASHITESSAISAESLESLRSANLPKIARQKFIAAIASSEAKADEKLKSMGVKNGLAGVDFSECKMDLANDDVIIAIRYTIEMQFPVFGFNEITVTKAAKAKTFGEILFEVSTEPNQPGWGSTSGDDKVVHGSTVQITATPNYGYKFVSWNDGNTDNPRTVTVTDAQHYIAIFEKDSFGVNVYTKLVCNEYVDQSFDHSNYGECEGARNYLYLDNATIVAKPNPNYKFVGWDLNGDGNIDIENINSENLSTTITVDKTYDNIKAYFKPVEKTITIKSNNNTYGSATVSQGSRSSTTSIKAEYGSKVQLLASTKDSVKYLFSKWSNNDTNASPTITVKEDVTYEAIFITNTYTVNFYNGSSKVHSTTVIKGSSIASSKNIIGSSMPSSNPTKTGATFDIWKYNGSKFDSSTPVNSNINVSATWKYTVTLNANGGSISGVSIKSYTVSEGEYFNFNDYTPSRNGYTFTGWSGGCSGNKKITSNVTTTASWQCKHKYDNGQSMLEKVNTVGDGGCKGSEVTTKCKGCTYSVTKKMTGAHKWGANCGVDHTYTWKGECTNTSAKHTWGTFRCITCKHCGVCKNPRKSSVEVGWGIVNSNEMKNYTYIAGSGSKLCGKHNGQNMTKYKQVKNDRAHKYDD